MSTKYLSMYKGILESVEQSSTCARLQVGALIVKNGRVISMGWNGVPAGQEHCKDYFKERGWDVNKEFMSRDHHTYATKNEIHAEQNAVAYAAKSGISTDGAEMYITYSPCRDCAKLVVAAGIREVYFTNKYDRDCEGVEFLKRNKIKVGLV